MLSDGLLQLSASLPQWDPWPPEVTPSLGPIAGVQHRGRHPDKETNKTLRDGER